MLEISQKPLGKFSPCFPAVSTQLQNLSNDSWLPTGLSGLNLALSPAQFSLGQQSQVTGLTGTWGRGVRPAGSCMRPFTLHRHCPRKSVLILPSHPRKRSQSRGVHLSNITQLINSQVHKLKHIQFEKWYFFITPLCFRSTGKNPSLAGDVSPYCKGGSLNSSIKWKASMRH